MFAPVRFLYSFRPHAPLGLLAADAVAATMFVATPFLVPAISDRLDVSLGVAGLISTAQVGGLTVTVFLLGRLATTSPTMLVAAATLLFVANGASALAGGVISLLLLRVVAGVGAGVLSWVAWSEAMAHPRGLGDVAATGPLAAMVMSPLVGWLTAVGGDPLVYLALAALSAPLIVVPVAMSGLELRQPLKPKGPARNTGVLAAMFLLTLAGSALFVYSAAAVRDLGGVSPVMASGAFSLNALAGILATRVGPGRLRAGFWLATIAPCVVGLVAFPNMVVFYAALGWWGFAFWVGLPRLFELLARGSHHPSARIAAAQGLMALGRTLGPWLGGLVLTEGDYLLLGALCAFGLLVSGWLALMAEGQPVEALA